MRRGDIGIEAMVETPGHDERVDAVTQLFGVGGNSFTEELGPEASEESLITPVFTKVSDAHHHPWGATSCRKAASTYVPSDAVGNERLAPNPNPWFESFGGWAAVGASQMRQLGKIAVSLGQVISSYARVYMIPWPESFNVMFNAFEVRQRDSLGPPRSPLGFVLYVRR